MAIDARTLEPKRTQRPAIDRLVILGGSDGTGSTASFTGEGWSFSDGDRRQLLREGSAVGGRTFLLPQIVAVLDGRQGDRRLAGRALHDRARHEDRAPPLSLRHDQEALSAASSASIASHSAISASIFGPSAFSSSSIFAISAGGVFS